jgi:outer membrane receptor protein involved in Fe transport
VSARDRRDRDPRHRPLSARRLAALLALAFAFGSVRAAAQEAAAPPAAPPATASVEPSSGAADEPALPADDDSPSPRLSEQVTVTATRGAARLVEVPASIAVLPAAALAVTAAPTIDDALRQVVGVSLFRRNGSRFANPTAQGVTLRGLGASGASRALVLSDGLPLNDPFGGWVYWARVPRLSVERLEVMRGGASDLYGSSALGGVVQALARRPASGPGLALEASAGGLGTLDGTLSGAVSRGAWGARLSAEAFRTDGHVPVAPSSRGPVDLEAASRHATGELVVERGLDGGGRLFARGSAFAEERENGTSAQWNDTRVYLGAAGADWGALDRGAWSTRAWAQTQELNQTFSAVAADRTSESLTRVQRVPASAQGLSALWSRALGGRHRLLAGVEGRSVSGITEETVFVRGAATSIVEAGGDERTAAVFVEDSVQAHGRLLVAASARVDSWWLSDGRSTTTPVSGGAPEQLSFADRSESAVSPRLALSFRARPGLSLLGSGYGSFRGPTLNELYRSFRVGDTLTLANPGLGPERLWGGEAGALLARGPLLVRATAFAARVSDAVANVTLSSVPGLVTRRRENVGALRSRGLEVEAELRAGAFDVSAGWAFTDSRVVEFPADPSLEGRRVPQVPRHQATLQARYESRWRLATQVRWTSQAWEDDRNELPLDSAFQLDLFAGRAIGGVLLFVAAENVFDEQVVAGRTPVPTLGLPRVVRAGVRVSAF